MRGSVSSPGGQRGQRAGRGMTGCCTRTAARGIRGASPPEEGAPTSKSLKGPLPNSSTHLADPLQDNDRNDSLCLLRIVAESREHIAMRLVETIALDSLRNRRCAHLELLRAHLNLGRAILHQIMIPAGMCRRAALRRRDDVAFTITVVDERRRAQLAAFGPARREEQEVVAPRSDAFSALRVEVVNNASVPIRHALAKRARRLR